MGGAVRSEGPAEGATSPGHGSSNLSGITSNEWHDTTSAPAGKIDVDWLDAQIDRGLRLATIASHVIEDALTIRTAEPFDGGRVLRFTLTRDQVENIAFLAVELECHARAMRDAFDRAQARAVA